ncbi:hypothetical protein ACRQFN_09310 [Actinotignum sp. GS-2025e]|uniref:hypothetical protein n=1 Tax=unclassified Actinotignum TaxID=2632702 RepID=UPI003F4743ED
MEDQFETTRSWRRTFALQCAVSLAMTVFSVVMLVKNGESMWIIAGIIFAFTTGATFDATAFNHIRMRALDEVLFSREERAETEFDHIHALASKYIQAYVAGDVAQADQIKAHLKSHGADIFPVGDGEAE